jgi:hypothetical protein
MPSLRDTRIYIYTIPKSGTYLMSGFVHALGFPSTGWHIAQSQTLETLSADAKTNAREPSKTAVARGYLDSFTAVPPGHHAYGHFSPLYLTPSLITEHGYRFIAIKRHPRDVLVSEFIDFRHRRVDVAWVSEARIPDPQRAFETYLARHGKVIRHICASFLLLEQTVANPLYRELMRERRHLFLDFARLVDSEVSSEWRKALAADNKTKAAGLALRYDRVALWTEKAEATYAQLAFDELAGGLRCRSELGKHEAGRRRAQ